MSYSDNQLMLMENLSYIIGGNCVQGSSFNPSRNDMKPLDQCATLGEYLNQYDEDMLAQLDKQTDKTYNGEISGAEWAAMLRQMKSTSGFNELKVDRYDSHVGAICLASPEGEAFVAFAGTMNGDEWKDNFEGMNRSDTRCQQEALDFINKLDYQGITVMGHSKGGNKAQYVTLVADEGKVKKCVSMDGQGFSQEFYDRYGERVLERGGRITNYSLEADFVNILLFPVPGSKQYYVNGGSDVGGFVENHSPSAFFDFKKDKNGNWIVVTDNSGNIIVPVTGTNSKLEILRDFVAFFLNNASAKDKERMIAFLSELVIGVVNEKWSTEKIVDYILANKEDLALFVAFFIKYIELFDISQEDAVKILDAFGMSDALIIALGLADKFLNVSDFIKFIYLNLTDGKRDYLIETILAGIGAVTGVDIRGVWQQIEEEYKDLDNVKKDASKAQIDIFDYSQECYNAICHSINAYRSNRLPNVQAWKNYSGYRWFERALISVFIRCINSYSEGTDRLCSMWEKKLEEKFRECWNYDKSMASRATEIQDMLNKLRKQINS